MNPLSPNGRRNRVRQEVARIRAAWPLATFTEGDDGMSAVAIIREPVSTCIIEIDPDRVRSLHVRHDHASAPPEWRDGWDD